MQHPAEFGGQGLPKTDRRRRASRCSTPRTCRFALCPLLTDGAIEALLTAGTDEQKATYLPKLISGKWTGTMNLTEPQAGSDLALVRTRAEPQGDGTYKVFGTKIFITYGEHDMAENIVHLVLARTPDAPEGVKGISLFVVPKFLVNADGSLGARNDVHCVSIEHKLGIKASPTAVLQFGDHGGAIGYLVGEENRGLEYMFIMMNAARFAVGMQGIARRRARLPAGRGVCEGARAVAARSMARSKPAVADHPSPGRAPHADDDARLDRRLLARWPTSPRRPIDAAHHHPDAEARKQNQAFYEYHGADGQGLAAPKWRWKSPRLGVQVHGGMGFIEETGAAQYYRDARILTIYEGTRRSRPTTWSAARRCATAARWRRRSSARLIGRWDNCKTAGRSPPSPAFRSLHKRLTAGREALANAVQFMLDNGKRDPTQVFAAECPI